MEKEILQPNEYVNDWQIIRCSGVNTAGEPVYEARCTLCHYRNQFMTLDQLLRPVDCKHHRVCDWTNEKLMATYNRMLTRCYNKNFPKYKHYGGKGIKICDLWLNSPQEFNDWSLANGFKPDYSLVRFDTDKDFSPSNCCWVQHKESNKGRDYKSILFRGVRYKLDELSFMLTGHANTLKNYRINHGGKEALEELLRTFETFTGAVWENGIRYIRIGNDKKTLSEWDDFFQLTNTKYAIADRGQRLSDIAAAQLVCFTMAYGYRNKAGLKAQYFNVHGHLLSTKMVSELKGYKSTKWLLHMIRNEGYEKTLEYLNTMISKEAVEELVASMEE